MSQTFCFANKLSSVSESLMKVYGLRSSTVGFHLESKNLMTFIKTVFCVDEQDLSPIKPI